MSSKFDQIRPRSVELAALERLKKSFTYMYLRTIQNISMTFWLAGERSLPFGLLVYYRVLKQKLEEKKINSCKPQFYYITVGCKGM